MMKSIDHICSEALVPWIPHSSDEIVEKISPSQLCPDGSARSKRAVAAPGVGVDRGESAGRPAGNTVQPASQLHRHVSRRVLTEPAVRGEELRRSRIQPTAACQQQTRAGIAEQPRQAGSIPPRHRPGAERVTRRILVQHTG